MYLHWFPGGSHTLARTGWLKAAENRLLTALELRRAPVQGSAGLVSSAGFQGCLSHSSLLALGVPWLVEVLL